ncbi:MAG TPA: hypothetical protein G4O01_04315 [Dehalococcoidia bacterium]|nr:hypothetical protein [Dehalococcoidia bacterium]
MEGRRWTPPTLPSWVAPAAGLVYEVMSRVTKQPPLISRDFICFFSRPCWMDNSKARAELGLSFTPLREGLKKHIDWLRSSGQI